MTDHTDDSPSLLTRSTPSVRAILPDQGSHRTTTPRPPALDVIDHARHAPTRRAARERFDRLSWFVVLREGPTKCTVPFHSFPAPSGPQDWGGSSVSEDSTDGPRARRPQFTHTDLRRSSMFGGNRRNKENESLSKALQPENSPAKSSGGSVTGFDPEGLERAAKAARDLDNSRNAKAAIELIKTQETTKQHEFAAKRAEMDAYAQQMRAQNIEQEANEARKTLDAQTQHERARAEYQDQLERKRQVDMLNAQKYMQE